MGSILECFMKSKKGVKGKVSKGQEVGRLQGLNEFTNLSLQFTSNMTWIMASHLSISPFQILIIGMHNIVRGQL